MNWFINRFKRETPQKESNRYKENDSPVYYVEYIGPESEPKLDPNSKLKRIRRIDSIVFNHKISQSNSYIPANITYTHPSGTYTYNTNYSYLKTS